MQSTPAIDTAAAYTRPVVHEKFVLRRRPKVAFTFESEWLERAAQIPGRSFNLAACLLWAAALARATKVSIDQRLVRRYGMSRDASYEALKRLEEAGLVQASRVNGSHTSVTLIGLNGGQLQLPFFETNKN